MTPDILKHTPFIYMIFSKKRDPFILYNTRVLLVLMLHTHKYLLTLRLSELCISAKRVLKHGCPNQFVVHILNMEKWGHSYTFTGKLKPIHITGRGDAEKGGYSGGTSLLCYI